MEDKLFKLKMLSHLWVAEHVLQRVCEIVPDPAYFALDDNLDVVINNGTFSPHCPVTTRFVVGRGPFDAISHAFRRYEMSGQVLIRLFWVAVMVRENDWDASGFSWEACAAGDFVNALALVDM